MKDPLYKIVQASVGQSEKPLILGLSGGPDSMCLLHLLLQCKGINLHIAHVDHGWRKESQKEAEELKKLAESLKLPFHLHKIQIEQKGNLEELARKERLGFFASLYHKIGAQALLLAHQADDQSETVLKRLFEGASLFALSGLKPISQFEGMTIIRPLLKVPKKEIYKWLKKKGFNYFEDPTNEDPKFLRARMRVSLIPNLSKSFGKEVAPNLVRLAETAQDLSVYVEKKIAPYMQQLTQDEEVIYMDFRPLYPLEKVELIAFLKRITKGFSHEQLTLMCDLIQNKAVNKKIICKMQHALIDRDRLILKTLQKKTLHK